jgi:MinD-like ATPase involved in chromosome partitioning or flagellar assembly
VGPNRDNGELISFALKGDLEYRVLTNIETADQALVVTLPRSVAASMAYSLVKQIEDEDRSKAKTRVKKEGS